jgi:DNA helicase IV
MSQHPELTDEQAYIERAYDCLDRAREQALRLRGLTEVGRGGTHQARYERDVIEETVRNRLAHLEIGDAALVFGRIDRDTGEAFHIGRLAVADERQEPVVVDWRAPVAEPFYRATGRAPMGLSRRRHFALRGRTLVGIEDELFHGDGVIGNGSSNGNGDGLVGPGALIAALEQSRTGQLGDIVATIQAEQDEIIRSPLAGVLVVQGGPGTGKTVVALHRAAYLLYTHRFPLEDQGVLVVGPNRIFLRYIHRVLPSLGETGVEQVVLADLVPAVRVQATEKTAVARVKGDVRMATLLAHAVRDRQRPLTHDLVVPFGLSSLRIDVETSRRIVRGAARRAHHHNGARRFVEQALFEALAASSREQVDTATVRDRTRSTDEVRAALEAMWPVLTPAQLLHDLFGSAALVRLAARRAFDDDEIERLVRARSEHVDEVVWTDADIPLLDEALALLGPRPARNGTEPEELRTYGHIVVDEAQDLTPMALRMLTRRSLNGSMTVVGDLAQATGALAPDSWDEVLAHLPTRKAARVHELTIGYRIPAQSMALAARVLSVAAPALTPPRSVREGDVAPVIRRTAAEDLGTEVASAVESLLVALGDGSVAVITPGSQADALATALEARGIAFGRAARQALDAQVTVVPVGLVKGLELDAVVVVEPSRIVAEEQQGLRALYVALTRATKRLVIVHSEPLPEALAE